MDCKGRKSQVNVRIVREEKVKKLFFLLYSLLNINNIFGFFKKFPYICNKS